MTPLRSCRETWGAGYLPWGDWFLEIGPQGSGEPRSVPGEGGNDLPLDPVSAPFLGGQRPGTQGLLALRGMCLTVFPESLMK